MIIIVNIIKKNLDLKIKPYIFNLIFTVESEKKIMIY